MTIRLAGRDLDRVAVFDDDPAYGEAVCELLAGLAIETFYVDGPLGSIEETLDLLKKKADAVVSDYRLSPSGYAIFDGNAIVARCYELQVPAVLCSSYEDAPYMLSRSERRNIPSLVPSAKLDLDLIRAGFERSIEEFAGNYTPERSAWRSQVQVVDVPRDGQYFYVIVSGRSPRERIRIEVDDLPEDLRKLVKPKQFFHARVNTGARRAEELYFTGWEPK